MGILNVTPDSFYDGGRYDSETTILEQTEKMMKHGATFIDVGGYSSRPGAEDIPMSEEIRRISIAIKSIAKNFPEAHYIHRYFSKSGSKSRHSGRCRHDKRY